MTFLTSDHCIHCIKTLSSISRFYIFTILKKANGPLSISALVQYLHLRQPTVSFHINQMADVGIIGKKRKGTTILCYLHKRCETCPLFK